MVKRKAEIELDEWLKLAPALARVEDAQPARVESEVMTAPAPTIEVNSTKEATDRPTAEGTNCHEDPSEWFWLLLEQSGHERW